MFMPTTRPVASTSGPPESPGSRPTSVWIRPVQALAATLAVARGDRLPDRTHLAGRAGLVDAVAAAVAVRRDGGADLRRRAADRRRRDARGVRQLQQRDVRPRRCSRARVAVYVRPLPTFLTRSVVAPLITWLFVSTRPEGSITIPVPAAALPW